ncbi:MAG: endo-1,4-beta-xylanase [Janthinobacterium lividum]
MRHFLRLSGILLGLSTLSLQAQTVATTLEAESGIAGADWAAPATNAGATYVTINPAATLNASSPGSAARVITYSVTFPTSGFYDLYARILVGPGAANDDSFFYASSFGAKSPTTSADWVNMNGLSAAGYTAPSDLVQGAGVAGGGVWKWINLSKFSLTGTGSSAPVMFTVPAGSLTQTFQIGAREDGLQFDKFAFAPTGQIYTVTNLDNGQPGTAGTGPQPYLPPGPPMATGKAKFLGSTWSPTQLSNFTAYWNQVVPSNAGKWGSVEGTRNVYNWTDLDAAYALAKNNGYPFRFHVLTWGFQQPEWVRFLSPADQLAEITQWYAAAAARYPNIDFIEVVNEPTNNTPASPRPSGGNYINALGGNGATGYDWILNAFRLARQYFPNTRLMINEYSVENSATNANRYLNIIKLLQRENLIDAIGTQAHSFSTYGIPAATITSNLNLLGSTGLPLYVTELDIHGTLPANDDASQLAEYQRVFPLYWENPNIKGMSLFGYLPTTDPAQASSYIAYANGAQRSALVWLDNYVRTTNLPCNVATTARLTNPTTTAATNGAINLMAQGGGTAAYTYSWTGPNGFTATTEDLTGVAPGTYTVVVTAPNSNCTTTSTIVLDAVPTISLIAPASGPEGASVVLTGTSLSTTSAVSFNGTLATSFTVNSTGTQLTATVPAGALTGPITVTTRGSQVTTATAFTVTRPLTTWTGAVSADWFTAGNWTAGVPTATTDVLIGSGAASPAITTGTASAASLTIAAGSTLSQRGGTLNLAGNLLANGTFIATGGTLATTGTGAQTLGGSSLLDLQSLNVGVAGAALTTPVSISSILTLSGYLTTNGQDLTLRSSVSGGVMTDALVVNNDGGGVVGETTIQRAIDPTLNAGLGYRHYAPPVNITTFADLATTSSGGSFAPVVNPAYNTAAAPNTVTPFPTVFTYDDSRLSLTNNLNSFDKGWVSPTALTDVLMAGQGVTVNLAASEVVDFKGRLNTGDFILKMPNNRALSADGGWLLMGNPYPAPLDFSKLVGGERTNLENAIYTYSSTSQYAGQYRTYNNGVGVPLVAMGQAFFVRALSTTTSDAGFAIRGRLRSTTPATIGTFQRTTADTRPLVQMTLKGASSPLLDEAFVYFEQGATSGFDSEYDAEKLANPTGLNLASVAAGMSQAINGLPLLSGTTTVPLTVGVPAVGTYTLRAAALANMSNTTVYLLDATTGQQINLQQQPSYSFTVSSTKLVAGRFSLLFGPATPLATQPALTAASVSVFPNPTHEQFTVRVPAVLGASQARLVLYNMLGQPVRETTLALPPAGVQTSFEVAGLPGGVYILQVKAGDTTVVKQVVIN